MRRHRVDHRAARRHVGDSDFFRRTGKQFAVARLTGCAAFVDLNFEPVNTGSDVLDAIVAILIRGERKVPRRGRSFLAESLAFGCLKPFRKPFLLSLLALGLNSSGVLQLGRFCHRNQMGLRDDPVALGDNARVYGKVPNDRTTGATEADRLPVAGLKQEGDGACQSQPAIV